MVAITDQKNSLVSPKSIKNGYFIRRGKNSKSKELMLKTGGGKDVSEGLWRTYIPNSL